MKTITTTVKYAQQPASNSKGFSLVELMVGMTLGLILMAGVVSVVTSTSRNHAELDKNSRQIENGRYAMQVLRDDIRHAGYYGEYYLYTAPAALPDPCAMTLADLEVDMGLPLQGYEGDAAAPVDCLLDYVADTDVLVIRRAATAVTDVADLSATEIYLQSRPDSFVLDVGADDAVFDLTQKDGATLAEIRKYVVHIYYIRGCSDCSGDGDGIPTLTRLELIDGNFDTATPIAEGIENLQLRYGIDSNGNGSPESLEILPASAAQWSDAMTVEVNILARNVEPTTGHNDAKSYTLGDVAIDAPDDNFKRHVFSALVRAENPSSRREM
jgi:type IV pilus assembly protein PilW